MNNTNYDENYNMGKYYSPFCNYDADQQNISSIKLSSQFKEQISIRFLNQIDIQSVKTIADENRNALGFLPKAKLEEAERNNRAFVVYKSGLLVGFVIFRHRKKDTQTTLSDICIRTNYRGQGFGKILINALVDDCKKNSKDFIQLKCPIDLSANKFYEKLGFLLFVTENGKKRPLNVWRLSTSSINNI